MCVCVCVCFQLFSCVWLFVTPWTVSCHAPLSIKIFKQEYWSGLPFSSSRGSSLPRDRSWGKGKFCTQCDLNCLQCVLRTDNFLPPYSLLYTLTWLPYSRSSCPGGKLFQALYGLFRNFAERKEEKSLNEYWMIVPSDSLPSKTLQNSHFIILAFLSFLILNCYIIIFILLSSHLILKHCS